MPKNRFGWLEIPDDLMIRLPNTGMMKDEESFSLSVITDMDPAFASAIEYTRQIVHSEPVGYFYYSRLEFQPRVAGEKIDIKLTFEFSRALHHGDSLTVYLENFGGPSKQGILGIIARADPERQVGRVYDKFAPDSGPAGKGAGKACTSLCRHQRV